MPLLLCKIAKHLICTCWKKITHTTKWLCDSSLSIAKFPPKHLALPHLKEPPSRLCRCWDLCTVGFAQHTDMTDRLGPFQGQHPTCPTVDTTWLIATPRATFLAYKKSASAARKSNIFLLLYWMYFIISILLLSILSRFSPWCSWSNGSKKTNVDWLELSLEATTTLKKSLIPKFFVLHVRRCYAWAGSTGNWFPGYDFFVGLV